MALSAKESIKAKAVNPRPVTREFAEFAVSLPFEALPAEVVDRVRTDALDTVAVGILGHTHAWVKPATDLWREFGGAPQARLWGLGAKLPLPKAVLANGHAANSFEFDDTYIWGGYGTHQGNNVVPAGIGTAELVGRVSGKEFLTALAVGHEIGVRVMGGFAKRRAGWNHTALVSTFGAAATAGRLLGLSVDQMTWALGSAGSYVGGCLTMPPTSDVKRMVNGRAAEGGVIGALLAKRGFSGIDNLLEAKQGGFFGLHAEAVDLDKALDGIGETYRVVNLHTKRFPMCTSVHAPIEAACQLVAQHGIKSQDVTHILVRTTSGAQSNTVGFDVTTIASAQLSLAFGIAIAIKTGNVTAAVVTEDGLEDPELKRLISIVEPVKDPKFDQMWQGTLGSGGPGQVEVTLRNGAVLRSDVVPEASRMTAREIEEKAQQTIEPILGAGRAARIVEFFRDVERAESLDPLLECL